MTRNWPLKDIYGCVLKGLKLLQITWNRFTAVTHFSSESISHFILWQILLIINPQNWLLTQGPTLTRGRRESKVWGTDVLSAQTHLCVCRPLCWIPLGMNIPWRCKRLYTSSYILLSAVLSAIKSRCWISQSIMLVMSQQYTPKKDFFVFQMNIFVSIQPLMMDSNKCAFPMGVQVYSSVCHK